MTIKSIKERLDAIQRQMRARPGGGAFLILEVTGGLPGPINFAYAGAHRWDRAEGEDFEDFVKRSAYAAIEAGEMQLNVGGLPRGDEYAKFKTPDGGFDFDAWWETVAPYYPEVPDEELAGYVRRAKW